MNKAYWDRVAPVYDLFMRKNKKAYKELVKLMKDTVRRERVLELGCGTGAISREIARWTEETVATDYSEAMIEKARKGKNHKKLHFEVADAKDLPYPDHSYDVVVICNTLHVMKNPEKALKEIRRVLKKRGTLICPTFVQNDDKGDKQKGRKKILEASGFEANSKWTDHDFLEFLKKEGWDIKKHKVVEATFPISYVECTPQHILWRLTSAE